MSKKKRKKKRHVSSYGSFKTKLMQDALAHHQKVVIHSHEGPKMSEALLDFIEPYSEDWYTKDDMNRLLCVAVIAWNASVVDRKEREKLIDESAKALQPDLRREFKAIVDEMIQRKEKYFENNKRMIVNYQLTMTREGPHVTVASTVTA